MPSSLPASRGGHGDGGDGQNLYSGDKEEAEADDYYSDDGNGGDGGGATNPGSSQRARVGSVDGSGEDEDGEDDTTAVGSFSIRWPRGTLTLNVGLASEPFVPPRPPPAAVERVLGLRVRVRSPVLSVPCGGGTAAWACGSAGAENACAGGAGGETDGFSDRPDERPGDYEEEEARQQQQLLDQSGERHLFARR
jgi:hypothetical protein